MAGLRSIDLAVSVALKKREAATLQLVQAQRNLQFEQGQLQQLESYALDAQTRWSAAAQISVAPELLRHHYQFMDRLRQAIGLQQGVVADLQAQLDDKRKLLISAEMSLNGLQKLRKRKQAEIGASLARRDQKQTDEFSAMQFARAAMRLQ
jgi:flagellar FliJ protein